MNTAAATKFAPGTRLNNGSLVLKHKGEVVLCLLPHNKVTPFATWTITPDGNTFHGDYFQDIDSAMSGFIARA